MVTLHDFFRRHYECRLDSTADNYRQAQFAVELFAGWLGHDPQLTELNCENVSRFLSHYSKTVRPATVNAKRRYLLHLWRAAWEEDLLQEPPRAKRIPRAKESAPVVECFTLDEMRKILATAETLRGRTETISSACYWVSIIRTAYETGGRIGSLLSVESSDVSISERWIVFRGDAEKCGRTHWHSLTPATCEWIAKTRPERRRLVWPWHRTRRWLCEFLKTKILKPAGVRCGRGKGGLWHKFRRTAGTLCEANGGDGSRLLGNTRKVFEKHYLDGRILAEQGGQARYLPTLD